MNDKQRHASAERKPEKLRTPEELEIDLEVDIGYVIQQTFPALKVLNEVLEKKNLHEEICFLKNAALESHLLFLRKLNEFFLRLPENEPDKKKKRKKPKPDDLRAEHYTGFTSPGAFLSTEDEDELHKRVGHITLIEVRRGKKDWGKLIATFMPIAIDGMLKFCRFLRDWYSPLSDSGRETVKFYIKRLELLEKLFR